MSQKTFFIGDVHGCYDELLELLAIMRPDQTDRVIFLWDMINKWPKSQEVIALIMEKGYEAIMGNHEASYLSSHMLPGNHFAWIRANLSNEEHFFIKNIPYYIDDPKFLAVHGWVAPGIDVRKQDSAVLAYVCTWNVEENRMDRKSTTAWHDLYMGDKLIMYGHWAKQGLRKKRNSIGLDTGCCYGGHLSGYCLETEEIWQVRARHLYVPMDGNPNFTTP